VERCAAKVTPPEIGDLWLDNRRRVLDEMDAIAPVAQDGVEVVLIRGRAFGTDADVDFVQEPNFMCVK
jgi:hypothetical protein